VQALARVLDVAARTGQRLALGGALLGAALGSVGTGCGAASHDELTRFDVTSRKSAGPAIRVEWTRELAARFGGLYAPVERAAAAIDTHNGRIYIGSTDRALWALGLDGQRIYRYLAESGIEAEPTLDPARDELYVATARGVVHALHAHDGSVRWKAEVNASISQAGALSDDALYLVTDDDTVVALARTDGSILWRYKREPRTGIQIAGHAGVLLSNHRLVTGFSDGSIVSLSANDGRVQWLVDTTLDFADPEQTEKGFVDVDTTPVQIGDVVYAASFLGGFYGIEAVSGAVRVRNPELTGITSLAGDEDALVLASAEDGVLCLDLPSLAPRWRHEIHNGAPGALRVRNRQVFLTESRGAFLAFDLATGNEQGRLKTEHGFSATATMTDSLGFLLGNAGVLYAFRY
jgi:outer membrane protein assembly factor BamB